MRAAETAAAIGAYRDALDLVERVRATATGGERSRLLQLRADLLIACIALAQDALLVTGNTKDYKDVAGLRIENWVD